MPSAWTAINEAFDRYLNEATDPTNRLVAHVALRYGDNEADELTQWLVANPQGDVTGHVRTTYVDPEADKLAKKVQDFRNPKAAEPKTKKGKEEPEKQFVDPAQAAQQKAATAATAMSRPDRAGVKPNVDKPTGAGGGRDTTAKDFQAMGTAGQNPAQDQPSLDGGKDTTVKARIAKLQSLIDDNPKHPEKDKIERTITKLQQMAGIAPDAVVPGNKAVPKTPGTRELEKLRALEKDEGEINRRVMKFIKANPNVKLADAKASFKKKLQAKIAELGKGSQSTVQKTQGMSPDSFYKRGGNQVDPDAPVKFDKEKGPEAPKGGTVKPTFDGQFIGQRWSPNAYTSDFKPDEPGKQAPAGGLGKKSVQYGDAATGQMGRGAVAVNPAKPGKEWSDEHDLIWAGKNGGWVTKSQFLTLAAQGLIKRKEQPGPSNPDLSKGRVVSPVNPPSARANLDNQTGRPAKK